MIFMEESNNSDNWDLHSVDDSSAMLWKTSIEMMLQKQQDTFKDDAKNDNRWSAVWEAFPENFW